jgi:O-antigen/teichoic acid export membrane protein
MGALKRSGNLLPIGLPALGSVILTLAVTIGDRLLILHWYDKEDVAHYSLAFDLNTKAYLLVNAINTTMFATMLRNYANGKNAQTQINIGLAGVGLISILFYLPLIIFSEQVLSLWIGPQVASASSPLASVMALACIAYLFGNVFENSLLAEGRSWTVFLVYCVSVGSYFLMVVPLQEWLGVIGFVWAYFILAVFLCVGMVVAHTKVTKLRESLSTETN